MERDDDSGSPEHDTEGDVLVQEADPEVGEPKRYAVLLHNDDYTTMEFVVEVLIQLFSKSEREANGIMLKIHRDGKGVAGIYPFDIAETKAAQVMERARAASFPLKCTVEEAD